MASVAASVSAWRQIKSTECVEKHSHCALGVLGRQSTTKKRVAFTLNFRGVDPLSKDGNGASSVIGTRFRAF